MGCSASTATSVSTTHTNNMNDFDPALASRSKASSLSSKNRTSVANPLPHLPRPSIISGTHILTKSPREKPTGRKASVQGKEAKLSSPYSVDLTKEMKPIRKASGTGHNPNREGSKRSSVSAVYKPDSQRILEEEQVSYIMCSTKTPKEALPPIKTSLTGTPAVSVPSAYQERREQQHEEQIPKASLDASIPLSPIPKDKKIPVPNDKANESHIPSDQIHLHSLSSESKLCANYIVLEQVNGDVSKTDLDKELEEPVKNTLINPVDETERQDDHRTIEKVVVDDLADEELEELQETLQKEMDVIDTAPIELETTPTQEVELCPIQDTDEADMLSNKNGNDQQTKLHHHRHHHHHHRHHHHHHRRGNQHHHNNADQRSGSSGGGGGSGGSSPEKTIKFMSKDAKTQFVFRAIKPREEESDSSNVKRDMLIQTDVISINDNNEKSKKKLLINLKRLGSKDEGPRFRITRGHAVELSKEKPQSNTELKGEEVNNEGKGHDPPKDEKGVTRRSSRRKEKAKDADAEQEKKLELQQEVDVIQSTQEASLKQEDEEAGE